MATCPMVPRAAGATQSESSSVAELLRRVPATARIPRRRRPGPGPRRRRGRRRSIDCAAARHGRLGLGVVDVDRGHRGQRHRARSAGRRRGRGRRGSRPCPSGTSAASTTRRRAAPGSASSSRRIARAASSSAAYSSSSSVVVDVPLAQPGRDRERGQPVRRRGVERRASSSRRSIGEVAGRYTLMRAAPQSAVAGTGRGRELAPPRCSRADSKTSVRRRGSIMFAPITREVGRSRRQQAHLLAGGSQPLRRRPGSAG